ncbi:hypothetical protein GCM10022223_36700 [Kineosporia mesophila]|uniref:DUF222 domain-containing protein n=1 Tax=Kineosporia mesophila TaxID=566012 RepID=A0ABP6ZSI9_9ACTN|nr:hypothetical protein [Kineosporia mesophila]MCD5349903.1 hypothetical protein [Kineosporia mesophila]
MTSVAHATAPVAPGQLGQAIGVDELRTYLGALDDWRAARKRELDQIDAAALRSDEADSYVGDLSLAMTMWQSVSDRWTQLTKIWDSGRVGPQQREEMSRVIWGTGTASGNLTGSIGLSLAEACRLSDALTAALRARLSFDPMAADVAARIQATRATLERCRDQLAGGHAARPLSLPDLDELTRRLDELAARARRGSDVSGPFAAIEAAAARAERDLIMAAAAHRGLGRDYRAALERRRELEAEADQLDKLVERTRAAVVPAPKLAVPDVSRLGKVPQTREALDTFRGRLDLVGTAMTQVRDTYTSALGEPGVLLGLLRAFASKAQANGRAKDPLVALVREQAETALSAVPCHILDARNLVENYQRLIVPVPGGGI